MIPLLLYYIVLPVAAGYALIRVIKRYSPQGPSEDVKRLYSSHPIEKRFFRAARRDHAGLTLLGDFETHAQAVEQAYRGKEAASAAGEASFLVFNDKGETLDQIDA